MIGFVDVYFFLLATQEKEFSRAKRCRQDFRSLRRAERRQIEAEAIIIPGT